MTKVNHYPKRTDVPKEEVLAKRAQRKRERAKKEPRHVLNKCRPHRQAKQKNEIFFKCRIPKDRKTLFELKDDVTGDVSLYRDVQHHKGNTITVRCNTTHSRHLDWFWQQLVMSNAFANMAFSLFPNVKEQSESVAALFAAREQIANLNDAIVFVVADGTSPRTAFLFARESKEVYSIDPLMQEIWTLHPEGLPPNLHAHRCTIEDFLHLKKVVMTTTCKNVVVVAVHSHAKVENYLDDLLDLVNGTTKSITVIAIPCCVPQIIAENTMLIYNLQQIKQYRDYGILSPCRQVVVWQNKNT